jgi:hypothetical protein
MRPHRGERSTAHRHCRQGPTDPPPFHSKVLLALPTEVMRRFYDTTAPTKEGLLRDNKIVSNL